jgi:hypothetical protein
MNFQKTFLIEASRENSTEAENTDFEGNATTDNASWSNNVDFFLKPGDQIKWKNDYMPTQHFFHKKECVYIWIQMIQKRLL